MNARDFSIYIRDDDAYGCSVPGCTDPDADWSIDVPSRRCTLGDLIDAVQLHMDTFHKEEQ